LGGRNATAIRNYGRRWGFGSTDADLNQEPVRGHSGTLAQPSVIRLEGDVGTERGSCGGQGRDPWVGPPRLSNVAQDLAAKPFYFGDRFEVTTACEVTALTHWRAPFTDGFNAKLPEGLVVLALKDAHDDWEQYPGLPAEPQDFEQWEKKLVPEADLATRDRPNGYDGFTLMFKVADIGDLLRRLPGRGEPLHPWSKPLS
jgi:hypothetical protein